MINGAMTVADDVCKSSATTDGFGPYPAPGDVVFDIVHSPHAYHLQGDRPGLICNTHLKNQALRVWLTDKNQ
jgi:hypothetical protein